MVHYWRVAARWVATFLFVIAFAIPAPAMPEGAMRHDSAAPISVSTSTELSFTADRQNVADLLNQALACHMHFEHHQLVCSANAFVITAVDAVRASYLTCVKPLVSLDPHPLQEPPRA